MIPIVIPSGGAKVASGSFTPASTVDSYAINVGFQPDFIVVYYQGSSLAASGEGALIYDFSSSSGIESYKYSSTLNWGLPNAPAYSNGTVTIYCKNYGNSKAPYFLSGVTYTWFAMKA